jgi:hypothetical protein
MDGLLWGYAQTGAAARDLITTNFSSLTPAQSYRPFRPCLLSNGLQYGLLTAWLETLKGSTNVLTAFGTLSIKPRWLWFFRRPASSSLRASKSAFCDSAASLAFGDLILVYGLAFREAVQLSQGLCIQVSRTSHNLFEFSLACFDVAFEY